MALEPKKAVKCIRLIGTSRSLGLILGYTELSDILQLRGFQRRLSDFLSLFFQIAYRLSLLTNYMEGFSNQGSVNFTERYMKSKQKDLRLFDLI